MLALLRLRLRVEAVLHAVLASGRRRARLLARRAALTMQTASFVTTPRACRARIRCFRLERPAPVCVEC